MQKAVTDLLRFCLKFSALSKKFEGKQKWGNFVLVTSFFYLMFADILT